MADGSLPALWQAKPAAQTARLQKCNEISQQYGLSLSEAQIRSLIAAEAETQRACGRLEFGEGILPRMIYAFCDSPFINRDTWFDTIEALQELFYTYQNELNDVLSDDELLEAMYKLFHGRAQGSLMYLENIAADRLIRVLRNDNTDEDDKDD